jgi:hypothetical protein
MPLAILIDNLEEFFQESELETFKRLSHLKMKLREINGSLWITQSCRGPETAPSGYLSLADQLLRLDHDGSQEVAGQLPKPGEWEAQFHLDLSQPSAMQEISLVKIRFQLHGSHRHLPCHYVYYRNSYTFREIHPPAHGPQGS